MSESTPRPKNIAEIIPKSQIIQVLNVGKSPYLFPRTRSHRAGSTWFHSILGSQNHLLTLDWPSGPGWFSRFIFDSIGRQGTLECKPVGHLGLPIRPFQRFVRCSLENISARFPRQQESVQRWTSKRYGDLRQHISDKYDTQEGPKREVTTANKEVLRLQYEYSPAAPRPRY